MEWVSKAMVEIHVSYQDDVVGIARALGKEVVISGGGGLRWVRY